MVAFCDVITNWQSGYGKIEKWIPNMADVGCLFLRCILDQNPAMANILDQQWPNHAPATPVVKVEIQLPKCIHGQVLVCH
jgi:hypothetical protein